MSRHEQSYPADQDLSQFASKHVHKSDCNGAAEARIKYDYFPGYAEGIFPVAALATIVTKCELCQTEQEHSH